MNKLIIRSLTGLIYVSIILASLFYSPILFSIVIFVFSCLAILEFQKLLNIKNIFSYLFIFFLFYYYLNQKLNPETLSIILYLTLASHILMLKWLFHKSFKNKLFLLILNFSYMVFSCFFIIVIPFLNGSYNPKLLLFVFIINWINNSFAYLFGKKYGKSKLLPEVSPKKSWEGFWGGFIFSLITAFVFYNFEQNIKLIPMIICSISIPILATLGDLIQSKIKRDAGVKDSGNILPGHGGFYDRMDSIIFVSPWIFFILKQF